MITLIILLASCGKEEVALSYRYLFLGHPYDWNDGYRLDPRLERIDYTEYTQVWLGGDVCSRLTEKPGTVSYLDSVFDFSNDHVQWTLGNHDVMYGNVEQITDRTGKPTFYTEPLGSDITLMVLNTNLFWFWPSEPPPEDCDLKSEQMQMMLSVLDTIEQSSHLLILHHHSLLKDKKPDSLQEAFNIDPGMMAVSCDLEDQFSTLIYPKLVAAQQRGVKVILVGGDVGMRVKSFEYRTDDGIWLLGSGINNSLKRENAPEYVTNFDPDQVLIFRHYPEQLRLEWEFVLLNDLIEE
ncbi:hypothetical protein CRP01_12685 [Flavilitoribacter nigricans DSM 23189 = NBRC 102662]|uniref:Calcineurin-like phosphoesterase domain-containing protein n=1 Tax=Flavilitoribacter nigricans (strain ATCC 23147 / DSM 23189 / NBRC 102662 / NCIMB 1420 / SS-2) TaxID=1122177 RepID=A0A2D0NE11_FLAN2|nr:hypothetical protein CRP01_12685 [Flavilitoribacter nigricans DSM 23189 = NBRC 102662]